MSTKSLHVTLALILIVAVAGPAAFSQAVSGRVVGVVRDQSGAVLPSAKLVATNLATGMSRETKTNSNGEYVFVDVAPGEYSIEASHPGFQTVTVPRVQVQVLQTATVDLPMGVASASENVTVTGASSLLNTETSDLGRVVEPVQIGSLPLNGQDFLQLATLAPSVNTFYTQQSMPYRGAGVFQGANFLGGTQNVGTNIIVENWPENATQYRIDRVNITNPLIGQSAYLPTPDTIQEFKVQTLLAPASLSYPASVNVVTVGGSNSFHGEAFEFVRNDILDATNYFALTKPALRLNSFGGQIGGPIIRNKLFFFGSYHGFRSRQPSTVYATVPTEDQLSGNFNYPGAPIIYDPLTGTPFPGNVIPPDRISDFAKTFNQFMPIPNFTGTGSLAAFNFTTALSPVFDFDQFSARVDAEISSSDRLYGRYFQNNSRNTSPGIMPLYGMHYPYDSNNATVSETHVFSPRLLNVFTFGYSRSFLSVAQDGSGGPTNYTQELGLQNLGALGDPTQYGLPLVSLLTHGVFGNQNASSPRGGTWNMFEFIDDVTWVSGKHTVQAGIDVQHNRYDSVNPTAPRGYFVFYPWHTALVPLANGGLDIADYLLGLPLFSLGDSGSSAQKLRYTYFEPYIQDDWRVTQRLTLNLGVRYYYGTAPADALNGQKYFDFSCPCMVTAASGKIHNGIYFSPKKDFAPRIGLAWSPFGDKTVIRAGYGIYFMPYRAEAGNLNLHNSPPDYTFYFMFTPGNTPITSLFPPPLSTPDSSVTIFTVDPHASTPYFQQWSLNVERQLTNSMSVQVGYVGSKGTHLGISQEPNQAVPGSGRPLPQFGNIMVAANEGASNYNALQLGFTKKTSHGLTMQARYEHANAFSSPANFGAGLVQNYYDPTADIGPSPLLVRNRFMADLIYELPFGHNKPFLNTSGAIDRIVGGWQVSSIILLQSGTPLNVTGPDTTGSGTFLPTRPDMISGCQPNLPKDRRTLTQWFDTSCFTAPAANAFGNAPINVLTGPGLNNVDITILKDTKITERTSIQFRAEMFNAFNHPQFQAPDTNLVSPSFGRVTGALAPRQIQLGLKLIF